MKEFVLPNHKGNKETMLDYQNHDDKIVISGKFNDKIKKEYQSLEKELKKIDMKLYPISNLEKMVLSKPDVKQYVDASVKLKPAIIWALDDVVDQSNLVLLGTESKHFKGLKDMIMGYLAKKEFPISDKIKINDMLENEKHRLAWTQKEDSIVVVMPITIEPAFSKLLNKPLAVKDSSGSKSVSPDLITTQEDILKVQLDSLKQQYLIKYLESEIGGICRKTNTSADYIGLSLQLTGPKVSLRKVKEEVEQLIQKLKLENGILTFSRTLLPSNFEKCLQTLSYDKKCVVNISRCSSRLTSGWLCWSQNKSINILFKVGPVVMADVDVLLCPVTTDAKPIGNGQDIFAEIEDIKSECQIYLKNTGKTKLLPGDAVPIYNTGNLPCRCLLLMVIDQWKKGGDESNIRPLVNNLISFITGNGYGSIGLSLNTENIPGSKSFTKKLLKTLWNMKDKMSGVNLQLFCDTAEIDEGFDSFFTEELDVRKVLASAQLDPDPITMWPPIEGFAKRSNVAIIIEEGSIIEFDNKVDVIVNSTSFKLEFDKGMVSQQLISKATDSVVVECKGKHPDGIAIGSIAVTTAGKLSCRKIFHGALYPWFDDGDVSVKILQSVIVKCLYAAEVIGCESIAFPALGAGTLQYPPYVVAKTMFETVQLYGSTNKFTSLKKVFFVLHPKDKKIIQVFRNTEVWMQQREHPYFEYPPKHLLYIENDLTTRIMIADRDFYRGMKYKEFRIVFSATKGQNTDLMTDWDVKEGCLATKMDATLSKENLSYCFSKVFMFMEQNFLHIVDVMLPQNTTANEIEILIGEVKRYYEDVMQYNSKNKDKKQPDRFYYLKTVRVFVTSEDYGELKKNLITGFKHKWHSADLKKFRFNIEVVGMNSDIKDVPKQLQKELSLQTTSSDSAAVKEPNEVKKSLSLKVKGSDVPHIKSIVKKHKTDQLKISFDENSCQITCEGPQSIVNKFKMDIEDCIDSDIYIDMTEDEYAGLLYLSREEGWKLQLKSQSYDLGRAVFKVNQSVNKEDVSQCVKSKIHRLQQLSTAEVLLPQNSVQNFDVLESQFESTEGILCFLSLDKSKIIIKAEGYEKAQQAKYMIEVNLGMVQQGGGRRNRIIASSDIGPGPVARQTSVEESAVRDGKKFRTKEGINIYVYCAGIGNLKVETLVNAANKDLQHGGGIAYHISNAAGYALEKECDDYIRNNGPIPVGSCCTSTAGNLPYKFIIHAVGPMWHSYKHDRKGECLDDLKSTILSALKMATQKGLKSIALPSISSGIFGVPKELCAEQYLESVKTYSHQYQMSAITEIHFIDKDRAMCYLIQKTFEKELGSGQKM